MTDSIRVGVIGAGDYGLRYHIPHLQANPNVDLQAIVAHNPATTAEKAARLGLSHWYTDYRKMLEELDLQAVVVSSPHALHYEHVKAALERGLHVLVDKHVVLSSQQWRELIDLARGRGLTLMPALNRHLDSGNLYAKRLIREGALGEVFFAYTTQVNYPLDRHYTSLALAGGGPIVGRGAHMAALIPWLTGWQPAAVTALLSREPNFEVERSAIVNIQMVGGQLFQLAAVKTGYRDIDEINVLGTEGAIRLVRGRQWHPWEVTHFGRGGEVQPLGELPAGQTTTDHFIRVVRGEEQLRVPPEDALPSVEIVEAAYESERTGCTVALR
ncbi:MAG: Gfo/Idh/MocA family protein [Chloroflexota bacterium]